MDNFALRPKLFIGTTNEKSCILMSQAKLTNKNMSLNLIHLSGGNMLMDQRPKTFIQFSSVFNFSKLEPQHEYPTPWKINMEPTNHPFRKENDLAGLHDYVPC